MANFAALHVVLAITHVILFGAIWFLVLWQLFHPEIHFITMFQNWFSQFGPVLSRARDQDCAAEMTSYLNRKLVRPLDEIIADGGTKRNALVQPVVDCILTNSPEYVKAQIAVGQVLLGLMPGILALAGPSSDELATLAVLGGKRILTYMATLASPVFFVSRAFDVVDPQSILEDRPASGRCFRQPKSSTRRLCVYIGEHLLVFTCLLNTIEAAYAISTRAINPIYMNFPFFPLLWVLNGPVIHFASVLLVRKRAVRGTKTPEKLFDVSEAVPLIDIHFKDHDEKDPIRSKFFITLSWVNSTGILVHLVLATGLFSGMQFIGSTDCLILFLRIAASVLGCRMVVKNELDRVREGYNNLLAGSECSPLQANNRNAAPDTNPYARHREQGEYKGY